MPGCRDAVNVNHSRSGIVCVSGGRTVGRPLAIHRWLAGSDINGVGEVHRHEIPFDVWHHEGEGTRDVMHGTHAASVCFDTLRPCLEVLTRVVDEGWSDGVCRE